MATPTADTKTILIVDDRHDVRMLLQRYLRRLSYRTLLAEDGQDALEIFSREPVDLVFTDLVMPRLNGIETIRALRERAPDLPIIAMSGGTIPPFAGLDLEAALREGADVALRKPFEFRALKPIVERLLGR